MPNISFATLIMHAGNRVRVGGLLTVQSRTTMKAKPIPITTNPFHTESLLGWNYGKMKERRSATSTGTRGAKDNKKKKVTR